MSADIEVADLVGSLGRNAIDDRLGKVAVRVDDGDPFPADDVVHGEVEQRRAFAGAGLADDIDVPLALLARERQCRPRSCVQCMGGCGSICRGSLRCEALLPKVEALATVRPTCCGDAVGGVTRRACLVWRAGAVRRGCPGIVELNSLPKLYRAARMRCGVDSEPPHIVGGKSRAPAPFPPASKPLRGAV